MPTTTNTPRDATPCLCCGGQFYAEDLHRLGNGCLILICNSCFNNLYYECERCQTHHRIINTTVYASRNRIQHDGHSYCQRCAETFLHVCDSCHATADMRTQPERRMINLRNTSLRFCETCAQENNYNICDSCGQYTDDDLQPLNGAELCPDCFNHAAAAVVRDYNHKPRPKYLPQPKITNLPKSLYLGVEIEGIIKGQYYAGCAKVQNALGERFYLKRDGSLNSGGIEIVSHPATLKVWKETNPFQNLPALPIYSYKDDSTGIHVHASKNAIGTHALAALFIFFARAENKKFITTIGQREYNSYCKEIFSEKLTYYSYDRYYALNITNRYTVEFRFFKGNVKPCAVLRALEFVQAIITFCKKYYTQPDKLTADNFMEFVIKRRKTYSNLYDYLNNADGSLRFSDTYNE
jgi:hypothetical protein